ncbi:MAG: signal peptidase II [Anaerolineae bacterium]|nr:signal peptidase II [Anaerolineae bacterium]
MKHYIRAYAYLVLLAGAIVFLDQLTKSWVRNTLAHGEVWMPWAWLAPYARVVHWSNTGVAFGMFQGAGQVFTVLAMIVSAFIIFYYPRVPAGDWSLRLALGMQLGGAVGNLIDRLQIGHVTDFISVGNFPVFNVADSSITLGVAILLLGVWLQERKLKKRSCAEDRSASNPDAVEDSTTL